MGFIHVPTRGNESTIARVNEEYFQYSYTTERALDKQSAPTTL